MTTKFSDLNVKNELSSTAKKGFVSKDKTNTQNQKARRREKAKSHTYNFLLRMFPVWLHQVYMSRLLSIRTYREVCSQLYDSPSNQFLLDLLDLIIAGLNVRACAPVPREQSLENFGIHIC